MANPTLTVTKILKKVMDAFKARTPYLKAFSTDFTEDRVHLGQTVMGHIDGLPTVGTYDANNGGYKNGATERRGLLTDIPVVIDQHKHVSLKWSHLNNIKDQKNELAKVLGNAGFVLGKEITDSVLRKCNSGNLSYEITKAIANTDKDTLGEVRKKMNANHAATEGRIMLANSDFMEELDSDTRIISRDYYGQLSGKNALLHLSGISGFEDIWEYTDLPANPSTSDTVTANASTDKLTVATAANTPPSGSRVRFTTTTTLPAGLSTGTTYYVINADATAGTFQVSATYNGSAVNITDTGTGTHTYAGYENMSALALEPRAIALVTGIPDHSFDMADALGIQRIATTEVLTDPETGFTLMAIKWMELGTFDLYVTIVALWGSSVGRQIGVASAITDAAGCRVITA